MKASAGLCLSIALSTHMEVLPTTKLVGYTLDCRTSEVGESEQLTAGEVGGCARPLPQLFQSDFLIVSVDFQKYND